MTKFERSSLPYFGQLILDSFHRAFLAAELALNAQAMAKRVE